MSDVNTLREEYKKAVGRPPFNGWDADELTKRIAEASTAAPPPSQEKANEIREESTPADPAEKPKKRDETPDQPFPSQADLDAMRAGTFKSYVTR